MRRQVLVLTVNLAALIAAGPALGGSGVGGNIDGDTTWTADATIVVTGTVTVTASGHLHIAPGTTVRFDPVTGLVISGTLTASGERSRRIVFTSAADTAGGAPFGGSWNGITFQAGSEGSMRHCLVRYGSAGVAIRDASPLLDSCAIQDFSAVGIYIDGNVSSPAITPVIRYCAIEQNTASLFGKGTGVYACESADVTIAACAIRRCSEGLEFYAVSGYSPSFTITDCDIRGQSSLGFYTHGG